MDSDGSLTCKQQPAFVRILRQDITACFYIIIIIIIIIITTQFSLGGSSPYTSADKTNNIHKRNNTKTQYKQYKTQ